MRNPHRAACAAALVAAALKLTNKGPSFASFEDNHALTVRLWLDSWVTPLLESARKFASDEPVDWEDAALATHALTGRFDDAVISRTFRDAKRPVRGPREPPAPLVAIVVLRSVYPCCGGRCRFRVTGQRLERFARRCPSCGRRWRVERTLLADTGAVRSDKLKWTATPAA